ncbi:hypothetical protein ABZU75_43680 [Streptosporangium sp. NPDC005286]|uniref:hypothetical protein n=1 Tax=Streptosporangium sp. NPDC005286 TaxID=3154463 RepID=UPI0033B6F2A4
MVPDRGEQQAPHPGVRPALRAEVTHALFNNCRRDNAQRNAARFRALVEEAGEPGEQDGQGEIWTAGRLRGTAT